MLHYVFTFKNDIDLREWGFHIQQHTRATSGSQLSSSTNWILEFELSPQAPSLLAFALTWNPTFNLRNEEMESLWGWKDRHHPNFLQCLCGRRCSRNANYCCDYHWLWALDKLFKLSGPLSLSVKICLSLSGWLWGINELINVRSKCLE